MELDNKDQAIIQEEVGLYKKTYQSLRAALSVKSKELQSDENLARRLTAEIVAQNKEEDKQALLSDESVAHGLARLRLTSSSALSELCKSSYFARVIYHEKGRDIEFKLGVASFPEERIIDWRKGPISKLYYHFEEGDDYDDEIAGVERHGHIKLKRGFNGQYGLLNQIEHKNWSMYQHKNVWYKNQKWNSVPFSIEDKKKIQTLISTQTPIDATQFKDDDGYMSQILSLLTPDQFEIISKEMLAPLVIEGSAGTGKTTVALHRMAWLLFEGNSNLLAKNTMVLVFHKPLVEYVKNVLPSLGVDDVKITTYLDFAKDVLQTTLGVKLEFMREALPQPLQDFKSNLATLNELLATAEPDTNASALSLLFSYYQKKAAGFNVGLSRHYLEKQAQEQRVDIFDLAFLIHLQRQLTGVFSAKQHVTRLDHLMIDEAQDFTVIELLALHGFLHNPLELTLAGDLGQKISGSSDWSDWPTLLKHLGFKDQAAINLNVAFRSTYQIYELAQHVRFALTQTDALTLMPKFGPEPKASVARSLDEACYLVKNWIQDQLSVNQNLKAAILCRTQEEAQKLYQWLLHQNTSGIRLADVNHFKFGPGITLSGIKNVKGLEFHAVCLFDVSEKNYHPESLTDRNLLYVGITRALWRLDIINVEPLSALLPESLDVMDLTLLPEIEPDESLENTQENIADDDLESY